MSLLDEIKRDRRLLASHEPVGVLWETLNRRSARVPDMEKALLAAEELAKATDAHIDHCLTTDRPMPRELEKALAAFRAATE